MFEKTFENHDEKKAILNEKISEICQKFKYTKEKLKGHPTGEIWIQFTDLVDNYKTGFREQRTGNAKLYLKSLLKKQPFFPASGHNKYGKSVPIFMDDTLSLEDTNIGAWKCFNDVFFCSMI